MLIAGFATGSLVFLLLLFHPIVIDLAGRATWKGQRGSAELLYLFGLVGIGFAGSQTSGAIFLRVWRWKKVLKKTGRRRPPRETDQTREFAPPSDQSPSDGSESEPGDDNSSPETEVSTLVEPTSEKPQEASPESSLAEEVQEPVRPTEEDTPEPERAASLDETTSTKDTDDTGGDEKDVSKAAYEPSSEVKHPEDSLRKRIKEVKARLRQSYRKGVHYLKLGRKIWQDYSPIVVKLLKNLWQSFSIRPTMLFVRFSTPDPFATGIFQGTLAGLGGMLTPYGIRIFPIAGFEGHSVHLRGRTRLKVFPYMLAWLLMSLASKKEVWKGLWSAWKSYRAKGSR